ncbi:hypothetical protein DFP72DRAFT_776314, partial [Ephemerocybe angulata]
FHGLEDVAMMCSRFIIYLFHCPIEHPTDNRRRAELPFFIAHLLHRLNLATSVAMAALILLCRLKEEYPNVRGSSGHRLFLAALMLADKFLNDESYENEDWVTAARGYYPLWEIHQMEREMCRFLTWDLRVDGEMLRAFENSLRAGFSEDRAQYAPIPYAMVCNRSR